MAAMASGRAYTKEKALWGSGFRFGVWGLGLGFRLKEVLGVGFEGWRWAPAAVPKCRLPLLPLLRKVGYDGWRWHPAAAVSIRSGGSRG